MSGALWVDTYRPKKLESLDFHDNLTLSLQGLAQSPDLPHLLVYGPSGAGKKTRIFACLREMYGPSVEKVNDDSLSLLKAQLVITQRTFQTPSGTKLELHTVSSNYHTEMTPSDVGNNDRIVVQEMIKEIAQTQQIDQNAARRFKVVVIHEADRLSRDAQAGLRRTMEKYMGNLRLILCCTSTSKIITPIRSRCLLIRVPAPSVDEISELLVQVGTKEGVTVSAESARNIATTSDRNMRKAMLMLEAAAVQGTIADQVQVTDWEVLIEQIATSIISEQSGERIMQVRTHLYELISHCIPADLVMKKLAFSLIQKIPMALCAEIIEQAAVYEHRLRLGNKAIYHLEAFVAKFMFLYKQHLMNTRG